MLVWEDEVQSTPNPALRAHSAALPLPPLEPALTTPAAQVASPVPVTIAATAARVTAEPRPAIGSAAIVKPAASQRRVNAADKRIINGHTDVNQLVPFKYKWAWEKYLATCANHWMPNEVNMSRDIATWKLSLIHI